MSGNPFVRYDLDKEDNDYDTFHRFSSSSSSSSSPTTASHNHHAPHFQVAEDVRAVTAATAVVGAGPGLGLTGYAHSDDNYGNDNDDAVGGSASHNHGHHHTGASLAMVETQSGLYQHYHCVEKTDTLQGISLRYGVSVAVLKKMNKLWCDNDIFSKKLLVIPITKPSLEQHGTQQPQPNQPTPKTQPHTQSGDPPPHSTKPTAVMNTSIARHVATNTSKAFDPLSINSSTS
ncbi:hypothetical protein Pelo_16558 [Pelomyxa schiedti]|nr:hypothetical protein Pelo_16714 [Pelomyxa schiedti]KAH3732614.1 hypothetical protein Pelo_16558 [Pelomyxa schiedti]